MRDPELLRLLRAAAQAESEPSAEMPYGFDTRVLAQWRSRRAGDPTGWRDVARLFRRVALSAVVVTLCAGSAAWWQLEQNEELTSPATNSYAIADNVIDAGTWQQ